MEQGKEEVRNTTVTPKARAAYGEGQASNTPMVAL